MQTLRTIAWTIIALNIIIGDAGLYWDIHQVRLNGQEWLTGRMEAGSSQEVANNAPSASDKALYQCQLDLAYYTDPVMLAQAGREARTGGVTQHHQKRR